MLSVPLLNGADEVFAVFNVYYTVRHQFLEAERRLLLALAQRAGLAIENARLYEAARGVAALEERQRLARALHDSVSQALYGIALNAAAAREVLARDQSRADGLIGEVIDLADAGLEEMRALIFELRPESLAAEGLVGAIGKQVAALRARHQIQVNAVLMDEPDLSIETKEALYRIVQEALHNVVKHARAKAVELVLEAGEDELVLRVRDDGRGFETGRSYPGHLGMTSMQERATAIGARLEIVSNPGQGTQICVRVPHSELLMGG
jgi:signal transduction histidine kinase